MAASSSSGVPAMKAAASKAKSKPIPRPFEDTDSSESLPEMDTGEESTSRFRSLRVARRPRLHTIKLPFFLTLGGIKHCPVKSRTRKTAFSEVELLPHIFNGQWRLVRAEGDKLINDKMTCVSRGVWRAVYSSEQYTRYAFKMSPFDQGTEYTTEEIRVFRSCSDETVIFIQEFTCWASVGEHTKDANNKRSFTRLKLHVTIVERVTPLKDYSEEDYDAEEFVLSMARSISFCALQGYFIKDIGIGNWGVGVRNGRRKPLVLDANSWSRMSPEDTNFGKFPGKRHIASWWSMAKDLDLNTANLVERLVYSDTNRSAQDVFNELSRYLAGVI